MSGFDIKAFVDRIVEDGVMTNAEHEMLMNMIHEDGKIDNEEQEQISRIFRLMKVGKLKIVDVVREHFDRVRDEEALMASEEPEEGDEEGA